MDNQELANVASLNYAAVAVFDNLNKRKRFRIGSNINQLHRQLEKEYGKIDRQELLTTFKRMESLGLGSVVFGRKKNKGPRFVWKYNLKDVAKAVKGDIKPQDMKPVSETPPIVEPIFPKEVQPVLSDNLELILVNSGTAKEFVIPKDKEKVFISILNSLAISK